LRGSRADVSVDSARLDAYGWEALIGDVRPVRLQVVTHIRGCGPTQARHAEGSRFRRLMWSRAVLSRMVRPEPGADG
jgi:hypothetical protein